MNVKFKIKLLQYIEKCQFFLGLTKRKEYHIIWDGGSIYNAVSTRLIQLERVKTVESFKI